METWEKLHVYNLFQFKAKFLAPCPIRFPSGYVLPMVDECVKYKSKCKKLLLFSLCYHPISQDGAFSC